MTPKLSLENFSTSIAIGSLTFMGFFFVVDHFLDLWSLFENYTGRPTWIITLAIPTMVITYVLGQIILNISEFLFQLINRIDNSNELTNFLNIAKSPFDPIIQRFLSLKRQQSFFQGCSLGFIFFGMGAFFTPKWIPGDEIFSWITGIGSLILAIICLLVAKRNYSESLNLVKKVMKNSN